MRHPEERSDEGPCVLCNTRTWRRCVTSVSEQVLPMFPVRARSVKPPYVSRHARGPSRLRRSG